MSEQGIMAEVRICGFCKKPLDADSHGLLKYHSGECRYRVTLIQKNEDDKRNHETRKKYYQKHKSKLIEARRRYCQLNPEKIRRGSKVSYIKRGWNTWTDEQKEKFRNYNRLRTQRVRSEVINHYGSICQCCGEKEIKFLCIDHINGGGSKHRKELKKNGPRFYDWLKAQKFPDGYRVLCHNCNQSFGFYGRCPHQS